MTLTLSELERKLWTESPRAYVLFSHIVGELPSQDDFDQLTKECNDETERANVAQNRLQLCIEVIETFLAEGADDPAIIKRANTLLENCRC